jgi:hypothetical protein
LQNMNPTLPPALPVDKAVDNFLEKTVGLTVPSARYTP